MNERAVNDKRKAFKTLRKKEDRKGCFRKAIFGVLWKKKIFMFLTFFFVCFSFGLEIGKKFGGDFCRKSGVLTV